MNNPIFRICLVFLLFLSCQPKNEDIKELTEFLFQHDTLLIRNVNLGQPLSEVKKVEKKNPTFEDEGGLLYEYALGNGRNIELAYACIPTDSAQILSAINVTIIHPDESDASTVYSSLERSFQKKFGVSDGSSGQLVWQVPNMKNNKTTEIHLKLQNKEILLSMTQF